MNYIVFDLEWNQGKHSAKDSDFPFEIIEIGAIKLDETMKPVGSFHRIIKPVVYPKLFKYTKKVIALTEEDLEKGIPFRQACGEFLSWCRKDGRSFSFATWGSLDVFELQRNMQFYKMANRLPRPVFYHDVQLLFGIAAGRDSDAPVSLENATKLLGIKKKAVFHSAINDARYTAKILSHISPELIKRYPAIDIFKFPIHKHQEVYISYPDHSLFISRAYKNKDSLKHITGTRPLYCNKCGGKANRLTSWYASGTRSYYMIGECRKHGFLKAKRIIKVPDVHHCFEVTTVRPVSGEDAEHSIQTYRTRQKKNK